jgi:uncharacterized delta-60 repeat protein
MESGYVSKEAKAEQKRRMDEQVGAVREKMSKWSNKIVVGGNFTQYNSIACQTRLTRLDVAGNIDPTFNNGTAGTGFNNAVNSVSIQSDTKILVGGTFVTYKGVTCQARLTRLDATGNIDPTFNNGTAGIGANGTVFTITIQSDSKILIGGSFTTYNNVNFGRIVRLNTDGSIDNSFNFNKSGFDNTLYYSDLNDDIMSKLKTPKTLSEIRSEEHTSGLQSLS